MLRVSGILAAGAVALSLLSVDAAAQSAPDPRNWRQVDPEQNIDRAHWIVSSRRQGLEK